MSKICSNNSLGDEMGNDYDKDQTVKKNDKTVVTEQKRQQREYDHSSITGRPNINEISKRNEAIANQERKSFYTVAGIIVLLIIAIIFLLYFFS